MKRTTIWLTKRQRAGLAQTAKEEGLRSAHIIRLFINDGLKRRLRAAK